MKFDLKKEWKVTTLLLHKEPENDSEGSILKRTLMRRRSSQMWT